MRLTPIALSLLCLPFYAVAVPSLTGQSGLMNMPDARMEADGQYGLGYSYDSPYSTLWTNLTFLPYLQMNGRFVGIRGTPGFNGKYQQSYGSYKDKVIDLKLRLLEEGPFAPSIAVGKTDLLGTGLFAGQYIAASKQFGRLDTTLGYGSGRIDGIFGGVRWLLPYGDGGWALLAEYDANNYQKDFRANQTFAGKRQNGPVLGVSYRWGWLGAELVRSRTHSSINTFVSVPFGEREFVPKIYEPAAYQVVRTRPDAQAWQSDPQHRLGLLDALHKQDYRAVSLTYQNGVLHLDFTNTRISDMGRAVGRAVRTALYFAPLETRVIKLRVNRRDLAVADYEFFNLPVLTAYLNGQATRAQLREVALVSHADPDKEREDFDALSAELDKGVDLDLIANEDGQSIQLKGQDKQLNRFSLAPKLVMHFNDPSGALRYEVNAQASGQWRISPRNYLDGAVTYKLFENVSKLDNPSNSLLPHVRTDIAEYKKGNPLRLGQLTYTHLFQPAQRVYGKLSAGMFEEMFGGVAGQLVYFPPASRWIGELTAEAVQQRDYQGWFGRKDYKTVTALASLHYKLPAGITLTGRAGRFLAKDSGVRMEVKRRFNSGIEAGAWYTYTDGKDITSPGSPSSPYHDKGLFMSIPLNSMLAMDTQSTVNMSISPWTRDVGQQVEVPHNLVREMADAERQLAVGDALGRLGERDDELPAGDLPDPAWWPSASGVRIRLGDSLGALPDVDNAAMATALGVSAVAVATTRDKAIYKQLSKHGDNAVVKAWDKAGRAAPLLAVGAASAAMTLADDPVLVNTGIISLQSAALAGGTSLLGKRLLNRARPEESATQVWQQSRSGNRSFPSSHAAVTMAAITPFAEEYQLPWLYVAGGMASAGRVAKGKHWLSDVVAGGLLGYGTGYTLWKGQRNTFVMPSVSMAGKAASLNLTHQY